MKRILLVGCCFLFVFAAIASAYTYTVTENLYTPNWANWTVTGTLAPSFYSPGGYGGIGDGSSGTMLSNATASEAKVIVRGTSNSFAIRLADLTQSGYWDGFNFVFQPVETYYHVNISNNGSSIQLYKNWIQNLSAPYSPQ